MSDASMNDFTQEQTALHPHHNMGLVVIAAYSMLKASLFLAIGIGAVRLLHQPIANGMLGLARDLGVDPNSHYVGILVKYAHSFNEEKLRLASIFFFSYAVVNIIEGIGLYLAKVWAEYLTLFVTASFLPMEIIQVFHRQTMLRVALLLVNLFVLAFLGGVIYLRREIQFRRESRTIHVESCSMQTEEYIAISNA